MDKQLETVRREKELADRVVRDLQDSLHDKASVVELNLFEAKCARRGQQGTRVLTSYGIMSFRLWRFSVPPC